MRKRTIKARNGGEAKREALIKQLVAHFGYPTSLLEHKTTRALYRMWARIDTPEVQDWLKVREDGSIPPATTNHTIALDPSSERLRTGYNGRTYWGKD